MSSRRFAAYFLTLALSCAVLFPRWVPASAARTAVTAPDTAARPAVEPYDVVCILGKSAAAFRPAGRIILVDSRGYPVYARRFAPADPHIVFYRRLSDITGPSGGHLLKSRFVPVHVCRAMPGGRLQIADREAKLIQDLISLGALSESHRTFVVLPPGA